MAGVSDVHPHGDLPHFEHLDKVIDYDAVIFGLADGDSRPASGA